MAGFSGGAKYLFPGISGPEMINATHWLGALAGVVRPWRHRALVLEALAAPERFLSPGSLLRRKWPQYAFFVLLNDGAADRARLVYRAVAYKLGVEGVRVPRFWDRLVGGGS